MQKYRLVLYRNAWYASWTENGRTRRIALRTKDRETALRRIEDFRRQVATPSGPLVGDIVGEYLRYKDGRIADPARLRFAWDRAKATFAHLRPDQIDRDLCNRYTKQRRIEGISNATILKEINVVRQALNWKGLKGVATFEAPPAPPPRDRHLNRSEFRRLLENCREPHIRLFVVLALTTAGRKSAILDLTWDRVDFDRRRINLESPGERNRKGRASTPMTDLAEQELRVAKAAAQTDHVIEFVGKPVKDIRKGFGAAARRAGLPNITPHDLRHTAAVWMAEAGTSMEQIGQYLGHTDPQITYRVYARFSPEHLRKAAEALHF